jgi:hypothetical protein
MLTMVLLFGGRFAEAYCVANDLEQAVSRVFTMVRRIVEASPLLRAIARITTDRVVFPAGVNTRCAINRTTLVLRSQLTARLYSSSSNKLSPLKPA